MIASLPMYDFPWVAQAHDAFWSALAGRLRASGAPAPSALTRDREAMRVWRDPDLVFGQTCGYPYWHDLRDTVRLVATPIYGFEGCEGPNHCSFLVTSRGDARATLAEFRGARAGVNAADSNSGMNLFRAAVAPVAKGKPFFSATVVTGAHAASLAAVAAGDIDLAAIDCVTFGLLAECERALVDRVKVVSRTPSTPALPYITSAALAPEALEALRRALAATIADPDLAGALKSLGLRGVSVLPADAYACVSELETSAAALGYPKLA